MQEPKENNPIELNSDDESDDEGLDDRLKQVRKPLLKWLLF